MSRIIGNTAMPDSGRLVQVAFEGVSRVKPGHWFRLTLSGQVLALPVLDASQAEAWLAFYIPPTTITAGGIQQLAYGTSCTLGGPYGRAIAPTPTGRRQVLLADATGLPTVLFAARLAAAEELKLDLALVEVTGTSPIRLRPSRFMLPGMPPGTIAGIGPLEDAGIPSRIANPEGSPGCHDGDLASLIEFWLAERDAEDRWGDAVAVIGTDTFASGITALLKGKVGQYETIIVPG